MCTCFVFSKPGSITFKICILDYESLTLWIYSYTFRFGAYQVALVVKNPPASAGDIRDAGYILGQEAPLEEGMATYSSILAWRIPWTGEPGGLQSTGSQRVRHD